MMVSIKNFLNSVKEKDNASVAFLNRISSVEHCGTHYHVDFNDGKAMNLHWNGLVDKFNSEGRLLSSRVTLTGNSKQKVRLVDDSTGSMRSIPYERVIMLCTSFMQGVIPDNCIELDANLMNSSASWLRSTKFGIIPWQFYPADIEWADNTFNNAHSSITDAIFKKYGKVYVLSAHNLPGTAVVDDPVQFNSWLVANRIKEVK